MKRSNTLLFLLIFMLPFFCSANDHNVSWAHLSLNRIQSSTFSNDGKYIAAIGTYRCRIGVFNTATRKAVNFINDTNINKVYKLYFTSNNEILNAIVLDKTDGILLKSWDLDKKSELTSVKIEADANNVYKEFFVSDKYIVGISEFSLIETFSAMDGKRLHVFNDDAGAYSAFAFAMSNDGRKLAGMLQQSIFIIDLETGKMVKEIFCENSVKQKISFSKDDKQLFTYYSSLYIYDIDSARYVDEFKLEGPIGQVIITTDNKQVICAGPYGFTVMDFATKSKIKEVNYTSKSYFSSASFCPSTRTIAISAEFVYLFNVDTGDSLAILPEHYFFDNSLVYSGDNKNLFTCYRGDYKIINRENGDVTNYFKGLFYGPAVLTAYNQYYYIKDSTNIMIADVFTGSVVDSYSVDKKIEDLNFSPDKKYVVASLGFLSTSFIMDWETKKKLYDVDSISYTRFSATGKYLLTEENWWPLCLKIRDTKTGEVIFNEPMSNIAKSAFFSDEKHLALYTKDNKVKIYNLETRSYEKSIQDDTSGSPSLGYCMMYLVKNNNFLIYDWKNGSIRFMDINSGKIKYTIDYFQEQIRAYDVSPDEKYIAVIYNHGSLVQFEIPDGILGVEEKNEAAKPAFSIAPNPATDRININAPAESGNNTNTIEIFDQSGKLVTTARDRSEIDISSLPAGVYYVRMDGKVQKMVKVR